MNAPQKIKKVAKAIITLQLLTPPSLDRHLDALLLTPDYSHACSCCRSRRCNPL